MTPGMVPRGANASSFSSDAFDAIESLPGDKRGHLILYTPLVRNNPYQAMLYSAGWQQGIASLPLPSLAMLEQTNALIGRADVWLHVHWTNMVLGRTTSRSEAGRRAERFDAQLARFVRSGGKIVWTVHNVLPHERLFEDLEIAVCASLAERATIIHVLNEKTPTITAPLYALDEKKVHVVPHSSYLGVYPNVISAAQARFQLGISPDAPVFAFFGAIRRYKGVDRLVDSFAALREKDDAQLIIAGPSMDTELTQRLRSRARSTSGITLRFERIPDWDVQIYLNACDVVVLPYEDVLNSGAVMLAFTFGKPVIASRRGLLTALVTEENGILFDPDDEKGLERAMLHGRSLRDPRHTDGALSRARAYPPEAMSRDFANLICDWSG